MISRRRLTAKERFAQHLTSEPIATLPVRRTLIICVHCKGYGWMPHSEAGRGLPAVARMTCEHCKGEGEVQA